MLITSWKYSDATELEVWGPLETEWNACKQVLLIVGGDSGCHRNGIRVAANSGKLRTKGEKKEKTTRTDYSNVQLRRGGVCRGLWHRLKVNGIASA